jgi:amino acid adenylation domain-containing protein
MSQVNRRISKIPPEQEAIRAKCFHPSGTFVEFPKEDVEKSIPERFEKIVEMYPDRLAVKMGERALTYAELNQAANRIAWSIWHKRGAGVEPIVLISEHGLDGIASCFGILKAGKILVVIDPSFPFERIGDMIANSQAGAIVTDRNNVSLAKALANNAQVIDIHTLGSNFPEVNLGLQISPDTATQIVYSSGSTGQPKGIFFNHRRTLHDARVDVNATHICPDDRIIQFRKLSFSAGTKGLFRALLSGAIFFPYEINRAGLSELVEFLTREKITIFSPGISIFRHFVSQLSGKENFPSIRLIILGCEAISQADIEAYKKIFPDDCLWLHHLSSSEAGLVCQYFIDKDTELDTASAPVGYPVDGKEIFLQDESGNEVDRDQVGEIVVRSRYLSSGYWRNSELTGPRFLPDPAYGNERLYLTGDLGRFRPDGCLVYLGRKDFVVKIRAYTVEIGEIERTLGEHPEVKEVGVVALDRECGEKYLAAYVVPGDNPKPTIDELRSFLKQKLPDYMVPSVFMFLESLPLTNGKLDRKALPKPDDKRPALSQPYVSPCSHVEITLAQIWEDVLNIHPIGVYDNFFDLGGHSLAATRVVSQVIKQFQLEIPLQLLFQSPTITEMATLITRYQGEKLDKRDVDHILAEVESLSDEEAQQLLKP